MTDAVLCSTCGKPVPCHAVTNPNPLMTVPPVYIQPGDRVIIPIDTDDPTYDELEELSKGLADRHPGVEFTLLAGTPMSHAIVYRSEAQPAPPDHIAKLGPCLHRWGVMGLDEHRHTCNSTRTHSGPNHVCDCGAFTANEVTAP